MVWLMLAVAIAGVVAMWWFAWSPFLVGPAILLGVLILAAVIDRRDRARRGTTGDPRKADMYHPIGAYQDPDSAAAGIHPPKIHGP